jgi:hypothetical protein
MSNGNQSDHRNIAAAAGRPECYSVNDADFTVPANMGAGAMVVYVAIGAHRTVQLPPLADVPFGWEVIVKDQSGACAPATAITVTGDGSDAIDGNSSIDIQISRGYLVIRRIGPLGTAFGLNSYAWNVTSQNLGP